MSKYDKWQALPLKDRAFLIKLGIQNGITDLNEIRNLYNRSHQFSGENDNTFSGEEDTTKQEQSTIGKIGSTLYDILEVVDPTGISSWATPEGDFRQALSAYKEGKGGLGNVVLEGVSMIPMLGKVGKAIDLAKGTSKIIKTVKSASKAAEKVDTLLELIPGVKKAASKTQAVTGAVAQTVADVAGASTKARHRWNVGIGLFNGANTVYDAISAISKDRDWQVPRTVENTTEQSSELDNRERATRDMNQRVLRVENAKNKAGGWDEKNKVWRPHKSFEGGAKTIGYGIKLLPGSEVKKVVDRQGYLTVEQEEKYRLQNLENSYNNARETYNTKYGEGAFEELGYKVQSLLADKEFNVRGGLNEWPKLMKEVERGNTTGMREQIVTKARNKKTGKMVTLGGRNDDFQKDIDSLEMGIYPIKVSKTTKNKK